MDNMITVILPFYNNESTIRTCIDSILSQTYSNFEVVCVNDESSDNSVKIINEYILNDSRIKLVNQKRSGLSKARNNGLYYSFGSYIQFIDAEDSIDSTMFEKMLNKMIDTNSDIVICDYKHPFVQHHFGDKVVDLTNHENFLNLAQNGFAILAPWNKMYKREVITERFDEDICFIEEDLFGLANMINATKVCGISEELYSYYGAVSPSVYKKIPQLNKTALSDDFWVTKETYWYKRARLYNNTYNSLSRKLSNELSEHVAMARVFDFMIWELIILHTVGTSEESIYKEVKQVFKETEFLKSLSVKEKYGVIFNVKLAYDDSLIDMFTKLVIDTNKAILSGKLKLVAFQAAVCLFIKIFIIKDHGNLNRADMLADYYAVLEENSTEEAKYVNELFG